MHIVKINDKMILKVGEGNGTPLQYSCLENPKDGGSWWAAVHGVAKSQTQFNNGTITGDGGPQARSRTDYHILISVTLRKWQPTPMFWPGESQGRRILVGCHLWGHTESDMTEVT